MLLFLASIALLGCGGVRQGKSHPASQGQRISPETVKVQIESVNNLTGSPAYDNLRAFLHLKTAALLDGSGQFVVVSDELLEQADTAALVIGLTKAEPEMHLKVDLLQVKEKSGATWKVGPVSGQGKSVKVLVRLTLGRIGESGEQTANGRGSSSKGAWGVLAEVNRESMLKKEGFWKLDDSMLGTAASEALSRAMAGL